MLTLETALRLVVIGQEFLVAAIFLAGGGNRAARISGALLMLGIVAYLYVSDPALADALPLIEPLAILLALLVPFALWLFARAVFEAPWPGPMPVVASAAMIASAWILYVAGDYVAPVLQDTSGIGIRVLSLIVVGHALFITLRGRPDDLVERRRRFRLLFVAIIALQVAAVLIVELALGAGEAPAWLDLVNVVVIAVLTIALAIPTLRPDEAFFERETPADPAGDTASGVNDAAEAVYHRKLLELMESGYYRETGLTIPVLAKELDYPEHRLRRLINGRLGFRNFPAFLNRYRVDAAKRLLADPDRVRTPVLTIALDLGYGSLGPFNRAFKADTGMTPTEYRRQRLGAAPDDSG